MTVELESKRSVGWREGGRVSERKMTVKKEKLNSIAKIKPEMTGAIVDGNRNMGSLVKLIRGSVFEVSKHYASPVLKG